MWQLLRQKAALLVVVVAAAAAAAIIGNKQIRKKSENKIRRTGFDFLMYGMALNSKKAIIYYLQLKKYNYHQ